MGDGVRLKQTINFVHQSQNPGLDVDQDDLISAFFELQYPAAPLLPKEHLKKNGDRVIGREGSENRSG